MSSKPLSNQEREMLAALLAMRDEEIDTQDIPEAPEENWKLARRASQFRPLKQPVTIRLDADVLSWFKEHASGGKYQTEINRVLRQHVIETERKRA